jgi:phenylacetic acid degradation operon negative regulatory protein
MLSDMSDSALTELRTRWLADARVSARSVLVTLLGDSIVPLGGSVWLSELIRLAGSLGFGDRLVRTSVFRLTNEGWVSGERVGRRSRYLVTDLARGEIQAVNGRIYGPFDHAGPLACGNGARSSDEWLLIFLGAADAAAPVPQLRWQGFAELRPGVWGRPDAATEPPFQVVARLGLTDQPTTAMARFENLDGLIATASFRESSGLAATEAAYRGFVERYDPIATSSVADPEGAFVLRTMLIHDYRRLRLVDPELPAAVLGDDWIGTEARHLAARRYAEVAEASWRWLETVTGHELPRGHPARTRRFNERSLTPSGGHQR